MTPRNQRRAVERKARKVEQKKLRNQSQKSAIQTTPAAGVIPSPPFPAQELKLTAAVARTSLPASPISEAQLTANRANALLSHGPVTDQGKFISARNNFRHGLTQSDGDPILLDSESKEAYAQLLAGFHSEWQPATATEHELVSRLVTHSWLRRRALNLQKLYLRPKDGLIADEKQFNLYRRYEVQHERAFNKAFSDLLRLRAFRLREQNGFESQRRQNEQHEYRLRQLKNREKLQHLAILHAEARLTLAQGRLLTAGLLDCRPEAVVQLTENYEIAA